MAKNILCIGLLMSMLAGCGQTQDSTGPVAVDEAASESQNSAETAATPVTPPGIIEMPKDASVDGQSPPVAIDPLKNDSGFQMPPYTPGAEPFLVKRPVLDDASTASETQPPVTLTAATLADIQVKASMTGKVCVVDFWSLSCEPCLKEFPGLVRLHNQHEGKVACMSVNLDYDGRKSKPAETYRERVESFLKSTDATFENFLCLTPNEDVYVALKIVSIPSVLVYDAEGKLIRTFSDSGEDIGFTYEKNIAPLVQSLVNP